MVKNRANDVMEIWKKNNTDKNKWDKPRYLSDMNRPRIYTPNHFHLPCTSHHLARKDRIVLRKEDQF